MGWTGDFNHKNDAISDCLSDSSIKKHTLVGNNLWCVMETETHGRFVVLFLLERMNGVWLHKAIDETCGPNAIDCPLEYLDGLPEPEGYAKDWRERVREFHESNRLLTIKVGKLRRRKHRGEDLK